VTALEEGCEPQTPRTVFDIQKRWASLADDIVDHANGSDVAGAFMTLPVVLVL